MFELAFILYIHFYVNLSFSSFNTDFVNMSI